MKTPKLGKVKYSEEEKHLIAKFVDSEFYKLFKRKIRPKRATQIAVSAVSTGLEEKDLWWFKGMYYENDRFYKHLEDTAEAYHKNQKAEGEQ